MTVKRRRVPGYGIVEERPTRGKPGWTTYTLLDPPKPAERRSSVSPTPSAADRRLAAASDYEVDILL